MNKKIESRRANSNNTGTMGQQFSTAQQVPQPQIDQSHSQNRSNGSPTQSLNNIQKISARLRARNPAIMSMTTSPQMLLPINQRNLSPASYNQLSASQEQVRQGNGIHGNALSVGVNSQNFTPNNFQNLKGNPIQKLNNVSSGQPAPTNNPVSRDYTHQRKILHKSLNSTGVPQVTKNQTMDSQQMIQLEQRGSSNQQLKQTAITDGRVHGSLNMSAHLISQRNPNSGAQDLSGVNIGGNNFFASSERNMHVLDSPNGNQPQGNINLNKKISGHRKRNAREKSYDLYNQKLQLPPMIKPGHEMNPNSLNSQANGKQERTYSLPSAGQVHQSMPMSPNIAMNSISSPKNYNTQLAPQRQSINEVLKSQIQNAPQRFTYQSMSMQAQIQQQMSPSPDQTANQQNTQITSQKQKSAQAGVVNLNSMKSFFNARSQGNRSIDKNNASSQGMQQITTSEIQKPQHPSISNQNQPNGPVQNSQVQAVFSPRRQVIPQPQQQIPNMRQSQTRKPSSGSNTLNGLQGQISNQMQSQGSHYPTDQQVAAGQMSPASKKLSSHTQEPHQREERASGANQMMINSSSAETTITSKGSFNSGFDEDSKGSSLSSSGSQNGDSNIQFVEVQTLLFGENPPMLNPKTIFLKNHEPTKASQKKCGHIKSYAANTNQGIIREYNEDRVSIILNILKPKSKANLNIEWPQICFFGVFDGHGGAACADYLRDNLHNFVVQNEHFPQFPQEAIVAGFKECEKSFLNLVEVAQNRAQHAMPGQQVGPERSGSCACVVMIINDTAYVVNVGDSRCIMSLDAGANIAVLSRDHKPDDEQERIRIQAAGGKIYRTQTFAKAATTPEEKDLYVQGPLRVFPGRLSVSRTFGDIEAKRAKYGGNANVIVCDPEVKIFKLKDNFDFFLIGCDGIFERLDNKQCVDAVWDRIQDQIYTKTYDQISPQSNINKFNKKYQKGQRGQSSQQFHYDEHIAAAEGVEIVLREAAASRSLDNITVVILGLKNLKKSIKKLFDGQTIQQVRQQNLAEQRGVKHTYDQDFEYLEVNEADLQILSDPEVASANSQGPDATVTVEAENKKKRIEAQGSPLHTNKPQLKLGVEAATSLGRKPL